MHKLIHFTLPQQDNLKDEEVFSLWLKNNYKIKMELHFKVMFEDLPALLYFAYLKNIPFQLLIQTFCCII